MNHDRHLVITASAGTGKTHQLSNRFLRLLLEQGDAPRLERILATTFTRKAAGEIFDRLVMRLIQALTNPDDLSRLAHSLECETLNRQQCLTLLQAFTRQLHRVRVLTLDAFFAELAHTFSMELPLPSNWQIADDSLSGSVQNRAIERMLSELGETASVRLVNDLAKGELQRDIDGLMQRLVAELFDIYRAAKDFGDGVWSWIPTPENYPAVDTETILTTIDALILDQVAGTQLVKPLTKLRGLVQQGDWRAAAEETLITKSRHTGAYNRARLPPAVVTALDRIARLAAKTVHWQLHQQNIAIFDLLRQYAVHYYEVCQELRLAFFSDIPDALRQFDQLSAALAYRMDGRIDHLLLDEFQDTSADQWQVLKPIAHRIFDQTDQGTFFCVGDVKQAIYAWRHGASEILENLANQQPSRSMNESRRSWLAVLNMVNQIFRGIDQHPMCKVMYSREDEPDDSVDRAKAEAVTAWVREFPIHEPCDETGSSQIGYACLRAADRPGENETELDKVWQRSADVVADMRREDTDHSIGVLVRTNDGVANMIHQLRQVGINASEIGGNPLTNSVAARLILSALRIADHPSHSAAWFHVANSPLGPELGFPAQHDFERSHARDFSNNLRGDLLHLGYGATIANLASRLTRHCTPQQSRRLQQLVDLAYAYQSRATPRPGDFLNYVAATRVADPTAADVQVLTVHQAKGLEFDRVIVTELDRSSRPISYVHQRDSDTFAPRRVAGYISRKTHSLLCPELRAVYRDHFYREQREQLCVLYVALTRARYELQIVVSPQKKSRNSFPSTPAGLVRAALCVSEEFEPNSIAYEEGDPNWHRARSQTSVRAPEDVVRVQGKPRSLRFADTSAAKAVSRRDVSPSELEGQPRTPVAEFFDTAREASLQQGTLVHGWLESIHWLSDEQPPAPGRLRQIAAQLGVRANEQQIDHFLQMLTQPNLRGMLLPSSYCAEAKTWLARFDLGTDLRFEVCNEQAIVFDDSQRVVRGFVDRLVLVWSENQVVAADVIDYKTDRVDSVSALQARQDYYAPQMDAYRKSLAGMLRIPASRVRTRLLFVEADAVREL